MNLEDRKTALIETLKNKGIDFQRDSSHKEIIKSSNINIWVLSNFGGQVVLNGSKKMIQNIRKTPLKDILYQNTKVNFFAIPDWGKDSTGKKAEDPTSWCFIEASKIYNSIQIYKDDAEETWTKDPKKDWKANINKQKFYWKSDFGNHRININWDNYKTLSIVKEYFTIDSDAAYEGYKKDAVILSSHRNKKLANDRKRLDNYTCQSCGFTLSISEKFVIECHHLNPLYETGMVETTINDLVSLCPTCHRIAHLRKPPYTPEEIRQMGKVS